MFTVNLRWPGSGTLHAARVAMREGSPVEIELPLEVHHALRSRLFARDGQAAEGDAELLAALAAAATGLEDLKALQSAVRRARYRVRVTSPAPVLHLRPPERAKRTPSAR
jgi:hypothetical protein